MYSLVKLISMLIRQFFLPNPFLILPDFTLTILNVNSVIPSSGFAPILNVLASIILVPVSYYVAGIYYEPRSAPAWGSFLFLLFYSVHTGLLHLMLLFGFTIWSIVFILLTYICIHIFFNILYAKLAWSRL